MNRTLTIWVAGAIGVVLLPLLFITLEGLTRPQRLSAARIADSGEATTSLPTDATSLPAVPVAPVDFSTAGFSATDITEIPQESAESSRVDPTKEWPAHPSQADQALFAARESEFELTNSFISDIGYFGGATDSLKGEDLVANVLSHPESPNTASDAVGVGVSGVSGTPKAPHEVVPAPSHPKKEEAPGVAVASMTGKGPLKAQGDGPVKNADKEKVDERERIEITIIRPRKEIVHQHEEIIGRCRASKGTAITLVKPASVGDSWWVQETLPRQATYFRARAQFGNAKTVEGSRFKVVVAFLPEDSDIPDTGTQFQELPAEFLLSQELEFTLKR
ncbi:MAG: hypothetical protein O3C17_06480 [Planctomycetota bacterium]|nr:hypothetical protein [Planctomycetota bacterium]